MENMTDNTGDTGMESFDNAANNSTDNQDFQAGDQDNTNNNNFDNSGDADKGQANQEPEKIKLDEGMEYSKAELIEMAKAHQEKQTQETNKPDYEKFEHVKTVDDAVKETEQLKTAYHNAISSKETECDTKIEGSFRKFLSRSNNYDLAVKALQSGNIEVFLQTLTHTDAIEFDNEIRTAQSELDTFLKDIDGKFNKLNSSINNRVKDLTFENFKVSKNLSEPERKVVDLIKSLEAETDINIVLDKAIKFCGEFVQMVSNDKNLQEQNRQHKDRLSTVMNNGNTGGQGTTRIFTRDEISKMSSKTFTKYEKQIFDQMAKGLMK